MFFEYPNLVDLELFADLYEEIQEYLNNEEDN